VLSRELLFAQCAEDALNLALAVLGKTGNVCTIVDRSSRHIRRFLAHRAGFEEARGGGRFCVMVKKEEKKKE